jgi:hypothetical protein
MDLLKKPEPEGSEQKEHKRSKKDKKDKKQKKVRADPEGHEVEKTVSVTEKVPKVSQKSKSISKKHQRYQPMCKIVHKVPLLQSEATSVASSVPQTPQLTSVAQGESLITELKS